MKFGSREIADVVFKAKTDIKIGKTLFKKGQPVLYIDTAKTSTLEGASTTVYATGGRGNTRLITWSGEKTLTFTVEDAVLSPIGFTILSGAGLFNGSSKTSEVQVHKTYSTMVSSGKIDLSDAMGINDVICDTAPIFVVKAEKDGSLTGIMLHNLTRSADGKMLEGVDSAVCADGDQVFVDFYVAKPAVDVNELQITPDDLSGNYYVEASTLFRRQSDGKDLPAEITIPNVKIQSNFTFNMAATGDPSTFSFVMDAMPDYTMFDKTKKVLCVIQVIDEEASNTADIESKMPHKDDKKSFDDITDSVDVIEIIKTAIVPNTSNIFGKSMSDIQTNIRISDGVISGTLKKVTGWTEFSSDPLLQSGHYLGFALSGVDPIDCDQYSFEVVGGDSEGHPVIFDEDLNAVIYVRNTSQQLKINYTDGDETSSTLYSFAGLTLA